MTFIFALNDSRVSIVFYQSRYMYCHSVVSIIYCSLFLRDARQLPRKQEISYELL